jgi:hypothetical protein
MLMVPVRKSDPIAAVGAYWKETAAPRNAHVRLGELLAEAAAIGLTSDYVSAGVRDAIEARPVVPQNAPAGTKL